jgi:hypothetical protein
MKQLIFLITLLAAFKGFGQASVSHSITVRIPQVLEVRFYPDFVENTLFEFNSASQLSNGISRFDASAFNVRANESWVLSVKAQNPHFEAEPGNTELMPCSIVKIRKHLKFNGYFQLSTVDQQLITGTKGGWEVEGNAFSIDYQVKPDLEYSGGDYTLPVIFTISGN